MTKHFINQHVWYNPDTKGYVSIDLTSFIRPPSAMTINNELLLPKAEFHCSLIALRRYIDNQDQEQAVVSAIKDYLAKHPITFNRLSVERYICKKDTRTTLIAPVEITGITSFYTFASKLIPDFAVPFPHVTLAKSKSTELGIGINSEADVRAYCRLLPS